MLFNDFLLAADKKNASDLHLESNQSPIIRVSGRLIPLDEYQDILNVPEMTCILEAILSPNQIEVFRKKHDIVSL